MSLERITRQAAKRKRRKTGPTNVIRWDQRMSAAVDELELYFADGAIKHVTA
jgi:hypothetical protein